MTRFDIHQDTTEVTVYDSGHDSGFSPGLKNVQSRVHDSKFLCSKVQDSVQDSKFLSQRFSPQFRIHCRIQNVSVHGSGYSLGCKIILVHKSVRGSGFSPGVKTFQSTIQSMVQD